MKTILLTLSLLAGTIFTTQAQTEAGKIIVGGRININTSKIKDSEDKNNGFSILPQVGFFVANNIAIGAQIGYSWGDARTSLTFDEYSILLPDISNSTFVATPFGRLYTGDGSLKFFGQLSAPLLFGSFDVDGEKIGSYSSFGVALAPGLAYFPTAKIGIELSVKGLYFDSLTSKEESNGEKTTTTNFGLDVSSLAPSVGVSFHF